MKRLNFHDSNIVMGILNATDDSFSGDGIGNNIDKAKFITADFIDAGVDIIDIGGESTRPKVFILVFKMLLQKKNYQM